MAFHTENDLKSNSIRWNFFYILAKDVNIEREFEIKTTKNLA